MMRHQTNHNHVKSSLSFNSPWSRLLNRSVCMGLYGYNCMMKKGKRCKPQLVDVDDVWWQKNIVEFKPGFESHPILWSSILKHVHLQPIAVCQETQPPQPEWRAQEAALEATRSPWCPALEFGSIWLIKILVPKRYPKFQLLNGWFLPPFIW